MGIVAMAKRVLDVGNCVPDHTAIRTMLERNFSAEVVRVHGPVDTFEELRKGKFDLVVINRKLDQDYSDGMEILQAIKADPALSSTPVMIITNYPEYEAAAVSAGAEPGFGKKSLYDEQTRARLAKYLS
jgi:CheY-like chemotaxis protein